MLATVSWIGGLATLALFVYPLARRALEHEAYVKLLRSINKRLDPLGWMGLAVLTGTGMIQMAANSNYEGFLAFENEWARAILFKHLAFVVIILISAYQTWGIAPKMERNALLRAMGKDAVESDSVLQKREMFLLWGNLGLGIVVLLLTAWARVSS